MVALSAGIVASRAVGFSNSRTIWANSAPPKPTGQDGDMTAFDPKRTFAMGLDQIHWVAVREIAARVQAQLHWLAKRGKIQRMGRRVGVSWVMPP